MSTPYLELAALKVVHMHDSLVYQARPISLAYWKLELGHRETQFPVSERNGIKSNICAHIVTLCRGLSQPFIRHW